MVKLNGIALAPIAVFCGIVNSMTADYANIRGFAATIATGKWWAML